MSLTSLLEDGVTEPRGTGAIVSSGDRFAVGAHRPETDDVGVRRLAVLEHDVLLAGAEGKKAGLIRERGHGCQMQANVVGNVLGKCAGEAFLAVELIYDCLSFFDVRLQWYEDQERHSHCRCQ